MKKPIPKDPIFSEPPDGLSEDSIHGFLVGGMAVCDDESIARAYVVAAGMLVEQALRSRDQTWEVAYPIVFLYRHAIELHLKRVVVQAPKTHGLTQLIEHADAVAVQKTGNTFPSWVRERLLEFADLDPTSTSFRYADERERAKLMGKGEYWVELQHLQEVTTLIAAGLAKLACM